MMSTVEGFSDLKFRSQCEKNKTSPPTTGSSSSSITHCNNTDSKAGTIETGTYVRYYPYYSMHYSRTHTTRIMTTGSYTVSVYLLVEFCIYYISSVDDC